MAHQLINDRTGHRVELLGNCFRKGLLAREIGPESPDGVASGTTINGVVAAGTFHEESTLVLADKGGPDDIWSGINMRVAPAPSASLGP